MAEKIICEVKGVAVVNFEPKKNSIEFKIKYVKDNKNLELMKQFSFVNADVLVSDVIKEIKKKEISVGYDDDDVLAGYQVVDFLNLEEAEEKLLNFFNRITEKVRIMRKTTNASSYMKMFDELKVAKMEL